MYNLLNENENKTENREPTIQIKDSNPEGSQMKNQKNDAKRKKGLSLRAKRFIGYSLIAISILLFVSYFMIYVPIKRTYAQALVLADHGKVVAAYAKDQNIIAVQEELPKLKQELDDLKKEAAGISWTKWIPYFGAYYRDFEHGTKAADAGIDAADKVIGVVSPYADFLGLKGKSNFSGGTQERIAHLVEKMDVIIPELDAIHPQLETIKNEMNMIDPARYSFSENIQGQLTKAIEAANNVEELLTDSKPFLEILPQFLGKDKPATYLVLFLNDKELRSTGGFITSYARLTVDKGSPLNPESSDIYKIDEQLRLKLIPPMAIQKYLPEPNGKTKTHWQIRDSNFYPDFKQSTKLFEDIYMYYKSREYVTLTEDQLVHRQSDEWDGIIAVDTEVVRSILEVLGPIQIDGKTFSSENDKRCNCPNVVYELESHAERALNGNAERKALIGDLMREVLLQSFKQEDKLAILATNSIRLLNEKHVQMYMHDPKMQAAVEQLDWAGRVASSDNPTKFGYQEGEWDYWHWNENNYASKKANLYVQHTSEHEYQIAGDGTVTKKVVETISNPQRNDYWLNAPYRAYFRAYVPKGSQLVSVKGAQETGNPFEQYGKSVFDGFFVVQPLGTPVKVELTYRLPFKINKGDTLKALFQKQAGTTGYKYTLKGLGENIEFDLNQDRKIEVKM